MKKQGGFTLIELVVVIVILGILAVTAAPKFLNLQDDAKVSAVKGLAGAMKGAAGIVYGKAAVAGIESSDTGTISMADGTTINTAYGYPKATEADLQASIDGLDSDWVMLGTSTSGAAPSIIYGYKDFACVATYAQATASTPATVTVANDTSVGTGLSAIDNCEFNTDK